MAVVGRGVCVVAVVLLAMFTLAGGTSATAGPGRTATRGAGPIGAARTPTVPIPSVSVTARTAGRLATGTGVTAAGVALVITPAAGPGGTVFAIAGPRFAPQATVHVVARNAEQEFVLNRPLAIGADGAVGLTFNSLGRAPGVYTVTIGSDMGAAMGAPGGGVLARGAFTITAWGPLPALALEPAAGPCATREPAITARGRNFPPNTSIVLYVGSGRGLSSAGRRTVGDNGTFAVPVRLVGCDPATPDGAHLRIIVPWIQHNVNPSRVLASATFTVVGAAPPLPAVPTPSPDPR